MTKKNKKNYLEVDVVFSISGRLRLRVHEYPNDPLLLLNSIKEESHIKKGTYCSVTKTFVLEYDEDVINLNKLILNFCGVYSKDLKKSEIKVNYKLSKKNSIGYTALVSLGFIILDLGMNFLDIGTNTSPYKTFIRWCAVGTTIGAIFQHGYMELNENGAFDPEVMSIMYLVNSINKANTAPVGSKEGMYAPAIAWGLTFGRHILRRKNRSIVIGTVLKNGELKIVKEEDKSTFFNQFMSSYFDVYQRASVKRSF
ncbi:hypothetical protein [Peptostreptococcus faecalis]|uniref:hypothetical protein n=1 Tax=Peptostreptococcus faecalis TaxID=2045015 RepID=UPI000C7B761B|nr:hypothetical protein [Peptostreptococcus faecalis]